jgi:SAM-dependent methyltransferase
MRMKVDFGRTAADYAAHRAAYPDRLYERLAAAGIVPQPGSNAAVDLATGTGMIARALARRGWAVTALDIAPAMIDSAAALAQAEGFAIDARVAPAENTDCAAKSFDLVTAFCCWHWFDRQAAAREAHRILKPGGRLVVGALDFHRAPGNVIELSSALIKQYNPEWTPDRLGFRLAWADELPAEMFAVVERHDELIDIPYSQEAWCGRIRASAGVSASMAPEVVATFDRAHAEQLRQTYGEANLNVPHRLAYFIAQAR